MNKTMENKSYQFYQGDISIVEIDPKYIDKLNFKPLKKVLIAEGEITGHKHILTAEPEAMVEISQNEKGFYLKVNSGQAVLTHNKHAIQTIPQGVFFIGRQVEYNELGERRVMD